MKQVYVPFIKTTDAELRGYEHLREDIKDQVLPLFELTRSRKSKNNPDGDITRRLESISDLVGDRQFILDLTTHESLSNNQIEDLLSDDNAFENWCEFVKRIGNRKLIPVVHAVVDGVGADITTQAERLLRYCDYIAFRVDVFEDDISHYIDNIPDKERLILLLDAGFLNVGNTPRVIGGVVNSIQSISSVNDLNACVLAASSFPASVVAAGYGQDAYGEFPIEEVILHSEVVSKLPDLTITYGDYASIHPIKYEMRGGTWVPRVDVPLDFSIYYHRYRREHDGYVRAANQAFNDPKYFDIGAWGNEQIALAAAGSPNGWSPAFWISVRLNLHITKQVLRINRPNFL